MAIDVVADRHFGLSWMLASIIKWLDLYLLLFEEVVASQVGVGVSSRAVR